MKIGGENAPPTDLTICSLGVARWRHPGGTAPGLAIFLHLVLDFSFQLLDLTKLSLIFGFNQLIMDDLI